MDDAHDAEPEPSPYVRLPWGVVAGGLVGVLAIFLAAGLLANRYLRPQVEVVPTPFAPAAGAPPAPTSPPAPTVAPTPTAVPTPTVVPTPSLAPTATPAVQAAPVLPTAAGPSATAAVPATSTAALISTPSPRPTVDPTLAAEVGKAYETYWQVRAQALLELDKSHLDEVMAGDHLDSVARHIDELSSENRAIRTSVDHDYQVIQVDGDHAQVIDDYISDSVYVDPSTQQALSDPASDELRVLYRLVWLDGKWKVVDSVQSE